MLLEARWPWSVNVSVGAGVLAVRNGRGKPSRVVAAQPTDGTERSAAPPGLAPAPTTVPPAPGAVTPVGSKGPPPITLRFGDKSMSLKAFSFCWSGAADPTGMRQATCADGVPPAVPPDVGSPGEVGIEFPVAGFAFTASFRPAGKQCGRVQTVPVERRPNGTFLLRPADYAASYDVTLSGRGDGELTAMFRWTTPTTGPLPVPEARLAVVSGRGNGVGSYGVEMAIDNLARTPTSATATITVTAANRRSTTFQATPARNDCRPEGSLYWDGPRDQGQAAAALGASPFTYQVALLLDGTRYTATAKWPDDQIVGNEPSVSLRFDPPLPGLQ